MSRLRATMTIGDDYEVEVDIDYSVYAGFAGSQYEPSEPASASILEVSIVSGGKTYPAPWLCDLIGEDDDILALCLEDDAERAEYAAEQRADAKREAMMLGDDR